MKIFVVAFLLPFVAGQDCPPYEWVPCGEGFMNCWGGYDSEGCSMPDFCIPEPSSDDPCYVGCPVMCGPDEVYCVGEPDTMGCTYDWCMWHQDQDCPAFCPMTCPVGTFSCWGGEDAEGCPMPDICMPEPTGDELCPVDCPVTCGANEIMCGGEPGTDGCPSPFWCMWTWPDDPCPPTCPNYSMCGEGEWSCPGGLDSTGCPMPDFCMPEPSSNDPCYVGCPIMCGPDEMICGWTDTTGCTYDYCMWHDSEDPCPALCPSSCPEGTFSCWGGYDSEGCALPDTCMPEPSSDDPCYMGCPVMCGANEVYCGGEPDSTGCPTPLWCADMEAGCPPTAGTTSQ